ncbi:hypothetical protein AVEN_114112-1 [Araneus ventricosus]|uniref:Uncharacterized protein n=1 Tax=Araneus ventricosus TaxID=182803 RepID=A0A4Y2IVV5_ARAVE|nr:hypothetical protein AVEN_114112-1 [Araneus ventricosus]
MDLVILNRDQMARMTPELAPPSPNFHTMPQGGRLTHDFKINVHQAHTHAGPSVESDFELGVLQQQSRDLTTRPPWPN